MIHVRIAGHRVDSHKNGVAIRRAFGRILDANGAVGAGFILDINLLAECARQLLGDETGADIGRSACRERDDETDRLAGIGSRLCGTRGAESEGKRRQGQCEIASGDNGSLLEETTSIPDSTLAKCHISK